MLKRTAYDQLLKCSIKHNALTVLKGPNTLISNGNETFCCMRWVYCIKYSWNWRYSSWSYCNFLAQGLKPMESCKLGVALHGHCAEQLNLTSGLMPSELINLIRGYINQ